MLSAVAARRARQKSAHDVFSETAPLVSKSVLLPQEFSKEVNSKTSPAPRAKRKSSGTTPPRSDRKRKKGGSTKDGSESRSDRYFARPNAVQDDLALGEDGILLDEEDVSGPGDIYASTSKEMDQKRHWSPSRPLPNSSDEDEDTAMQAFPAPGETNPGIFLEELRLSTYLPVAGQNTFVVTPAELRGLELDKGEVDDISIVLSMSEGEQLCLLGCYSLTVLKGAVVICGVTLKPSRTLHRVFASRCAPVPVLYCVETDSISPFGDEIGRIPSLNAFSQDKCALVVVRALKCGIEGLANVCRTFERTFSSSYSSASSDLGIPGISIVTERARDVSPLVVPLHWENAISGLFNAIIDGDASKVSSQSLEPVICLVRGPKKTGKSTFSRLLVNRLLGRYQRVAFLETDVGQSEFTPGGMVALNIIESFLFGPPFSHPSLPFRAHYIGSTSPRSSPSHYMSAIQDLIQSYRLDVQHGTLMHDPIDDGRIAHHIPLVVNTMGWTKGLGSNLLHKIEEMVEPACVFLFSDANVPGVRIGDSEEPDDRPPNIFVLNPAVPPEQLATYSAADMRTLTILSYFHASFPSPADDPLSETSARSWQTSMPLCSFPPYEVTSSEALDKVILTGASAEDVVPAEVADVLNGAIVGLLSCEPGTVDSQCDPDAAGSLPFIQGEGSPIPSVSSCNGLAVIRSLSTTTPSVLHVLTPVPQCLLGLSRVLVKGEMELPVWGMLDFREFDGNEGVAGIESSRVPYLKWGRGEGLGGERRRVRRNLMRKGQM